MAKTMQVLLQEAIDCHVRATQDRRHDLLLEALDQYNGLLNQAPEEIAIIFQIATVYQQLGCNGLAINLFKTLVERKPAMFEAWNNLGSAYKNEHMDEEARQCWEKAVELSPRSEYYNNLSTLYVNKGNPHAGIPFSIKALELDPANAKAHWNYALLLLEAGDWLNGLYEYEYGITTQDRTICQYSEDPAEVPVWNGEDITGKTLVVWGEQGLGDEIMFMHGLLPLVDYVHQHGGKVIYDCHDRLEGVARRSFPQLDKIIPTRKDITAKQWGERPDYRMAVGSTFFRFLRDGKFDRTPYLKADPEKVAEYRKWLEAAGPGPYIGISYEGGAKSTHGHHRSFQLSPLKPILRAPATFISLQYTPGAREKFKNFYRDTGIRVHHWPEVVEAHLSEETRSPGFDYDETLALLCALDLVIVPNTTAVHACGALGVPCWTLTPDGKAWRYCNSHDPKHMAMYGDHVVQYVENGSWENTIEQMQIDLAAFIRQKAVA